VSHPSSRIGGLVAVRVRVYNPARTRWVQPFFAVDTGATRTVVAPHVLEGLGYERDVSPVLGEMTTGSGVVSVRRIHIPRVDALGHTAALDVIAHALPPSALVDGLLGLDFFAERELCLQLRDGTLRLT
jgi:predicted aspartyl protease